MARAGSMPEIDRGVYLIGEISWRLCVFEGIRMSCADRWANLMDFVAHSTLCSRPRLY